MSAGQFNQTLLELTLSQNLKKGEGRMWLSIKALDSLSTMAKKEVYVHINTHKYIHVHEHMHIYACMHKSTALLFSIFYFCQTAHAKHVLPH